MCFKFTLNFTISNNSFEGSLKIKALIFVLAFLFTAEAALAQGNLNKCATMTNWRTTTLKDPNAVTRMQEVELRTMEFIQQRNNSSRGSQTIITIPVVIHVLWNTPEENISFDQINSQIDILNKDFRLLNDDSLDVNHPFWEFTADCGIEFCLASFDPSGQPTSGITRTYTTVESFSGNGEEKSSLTGGVDNWDPHHYLNIWVCDLSASGGTLGYATFPSELNTEPELDGVVINHTAFGTGGTAQYPNDLGRTATHEIGHWLNLRHIWGDDTCGDDFVDDTEPAETSNAQCPSFPHNAFNNCGSGEFGEMYMNYMDYVDDDCMNMFTFGQSSRMDAALFGERVAILNSAGCSGFVNIGQSDSPEFRVFPNPSNGDFQIQSLDAHKIDILYVIDLQGMVVEEFESIYPTETLRLRNNYKTHGVYILKIISGDKLYHSKLIYE